MLVEYFNKFVSFFFFFFQKLLDPSPAYHIYVCILFLFFILVSSNLSDTEVRFTDLLFPQSSMEPFGKNPMFSHFSPSLLKILRQN